MISEKLIQYIEKTNVGLAAQLRYFNEKRYDEIGNPEYLQNLWLELEEFKAEIIKPFYEASDEVTNAVAENVGMNNGFQDAGGEVYEVVVPKGSYTYYKHIAIEKTTIGRAKELGFEKQDKRKKTK